MYLFYLIICLFIDSLIFFGVIGDINLHITIQNKGLEWTRGRRLYLWRNFSSIAIANAERLLGVELCQVPWEIQGGIKHFTELTYLMSILPPHPQMVSSMSTGGGFSFGMIFLPWCYKPWKMSWLSGWELLLSSPCLKGIWNSFMSPFTIYYDLPTSLKAQRAGLVHMASWWLVVLPHEKVRLWPAHRLEACGGAC